MSFEVVKLGNDNSTVYVGDTSDSTIEIYQLNDLIDIATNNNLIIRGLNPKTGAVCVNSTAKFTEWGISSMSEVFCRAISTGKRGSASYNNGNYASRGLTCGNFLDSITKNKDNGVFVLNFTAELGFALKYDNKNGRKVVVNDPFKKTVQYDKFIELGKRVCELHNCSLVPIREWLSPNKCDDAEDLYSQLQQSTSFTGKIFYHSVYEVEMNCGVVCDATVDRLVELFKNA